MAGIHRNELHLGRLLPTTHDLPGEVGRQHLIPKGDHHQPLLPSHQRQQIRQVIIYMSRFDDEQNPVMGVELR
jgi:hypothetical protein